MPGVGNLVGETSIVDGMHISVIKKVRRDFMQAAVLLVILREENNAVRVNRYSSA